MSRLSIVFGAFSAILLIGCGSTAPPAVSSREAATASFTNTPASQPLRTPTTSVMDLAAEFDAQLIRLLNSEPIASVSEKLPVDESQLIATVIDSIAQFRQALRSDNTLMSARTAPLLDLSDRIRAQTPLNLPTLAVCRSVTQFGAYSEFESARFPAGKETPCIVYCEVQNFASKEADAGRWETKLSYEAALYDSTNAGKSSPILSKKPATIVDECRNHRRDFFLADRLTLPANLPVGQYVLKVTVIDQLADRVAEKSIPITIEAN